MKLMMLIDRLPIYSQNEQDVISDDLCYQVPTPQSPVNPLPPNRPDLFSPGLVNVPGPSVAGPMQSVPMVQDRKYVPGPSTALPGGVVPKTERFDT